MPKRYRKKTSTEMEQYLGDHESWIAVKEFAGQDVRLGVIDCEVWDKLHEVWIPFKAGDFIAQGPKGEFYPIKGDVHAETYEEVD